MNPIIVKEIITELKKYAYTLDCEGNELHYLVNIKRVLKDFEVKEWLYTEKEKQNIKGLNMN